MSTPSATPSLSSTPTPAPADPPAPSARSPSPPRIQVIDRAARLLETIARYPEPVSLKVLGAETGLHASTAHRILASLIQNGLVERDRAGHYRLGLRLLQLGVRLRGDVDLRAIARPVMETLRDQLGESINLTIREGDEVVYIEKATPKRMIHVQQLIGARAPLHVTAVGKLMPPAASASCSTTAPGALREASVPVERTRSTPTPSAPICRPTPATRSATSRACARPACAGSARATRSTTRRPSSMSAASASCSTTAPGASAGGLSISAPIERRQLAWIQDLQQARRSISEQLG